MEEKVQKEGMEGEATPSQMTREQEVYVTGLMKTLHDKGTHKEVLKMLQSDDPVQTIPLAANMIFERYNKSVEDKKQKVTPLETKLVGGTYVISDLIDMTEASGIPIPQEAKQGILTQSMQMYIEKGLKNKTIDPIELQQVIEPLMGEGQKEQALRIGASTGVPSEPNEMTALEVYGAQREQKGQTKALKGVA